MLELIEHLKTMTPWKKFSQCGEEAYIATIMDAIKTQSKFIVELGAGDGIYLSNGKYFEENLGFSRLMIDGNGRGNKEVKEHWILTENICHLLKEYNCPKEFALLSIDLDGNDYYILDEILESGCKPDLIVAEMNGKFPIDVCVSIAYNANHAWGEDDYYGMSFGAIIKLCDAHGYTVIFQNDSLNAYAVRKELLPDGFKPTISFNPEAYHPLSKRADVNWITI